MTRVLVVVALCVAFGAVAYVAVMAFRPHRTARTLPVPVLPHAYTCVPDRTPGVAPGACDPSTPMKCPAGFLANADGGVVCVPRRDLP